MFKNGFKYGMGNALGTIAGLILSAYILKKFKGEQTPNTNEGTE